MKTIALSDVTKAGALPADLDIIRAAVVRQVIPETTLWRLERNGELPALRIGRRRFYRRSDWEKFLNRCATRAPLAVPWSKPPDSPEPAAPATQRSARTTRRVTP